MVPDWAKELDCSITVCDKNGIIVYMNDRAVEQYKKHGNLVGKNLFDCHNEHAMGIIRKLLAEGGTNSYTIEKNGTHKMIFQSAWKENGAVAGLCEISMIIPAELPHYVRSTQS